MPLVVTKAARKPNFVDAPVPEAALRREHAMVGTHQPRFTRAFMRMTRGLLERGTKRELLAALRDVAGGRATIEEAVDTVPWYRPTDPLSEKLWNMLAGSLRAAYSEIMEDAGDAEMRALGIPLKFTVEKAAVPRGIPINPFSIAWVRTRSVRMVTEISEQQRSLLREIISAGFEEGQRPEAILDQISDLVGLTDHERNAVLTRNERLTAAGVPEAKRRAAVRRYRDQLLRKRAQRIARTETIEAYTQGLQDSWQLAKEEGFIEPTAMKEWVEITASPRTCKICRGLAKQRVPIDQPFVSDIVGEVMRPPAHPHCRCTIVLVTIDDLSELDFADLDTQAARNTLARG